MSLNLGVKIFDRKGTLYLEYYEKGVRYKKSTKLKNTKANTALVKREILPLVIQSLLNDKPVDIFHKPVDFDYDKSIYYYLDLVLQRTKFKKNETYRVYTVFIDLFKNNFENNLLSNITKKDIDKYISFLISKYKKKSVKVALAPIRLAFNLAYDDEVIHRKMVFNVNMQDDISVKSSLTLEQLKQLLDSSDFILKTYLQIAMYTGLRVSEICAIRWSDIDFKRDFIHIQHIVKNGEEQLPKNNRTWFCPLNPLLKQYLLSLKHESNYIINVSEHTIYQKFIKLQKDLGFTKICGTHILRHTFISQNIMAGLSPHYIKLFTGHKSTNMIDTVYTHYLSNLNDMEKYNKYLSQNWNT